MGVSRRRMDKLMDGAGGAPGVAAKVGELLTHIRGGRWCEEQASLMRGLAFGLLDPRRRALRTRPGAPARVPGLSCVRGFAARIGGGAAAAVAAARRPRRRRRRGGRGRERGRGRGRRRRHRRRLGHAGRLDDRQARGELSDRCSAWAPAASGSGASRPAARPTRRRPRRAAPTAPASDGGRRSTCRSRSHRWRPRSGQWPRRWRSRAWRAEVGAAERAARPPERAEREFGLESESAVNPPAPVAMNARAARLAVVGPAPAVTSGSGAGSAVASRRAEREFGVQ